MKDIFFVEELLTLNVLLYDVGIVDGTIIGELARRSMQRYEKTVRQLRFDNHFCYMSKIDAVLRPFCSSECDTFFNRSFNLE